MFWALQERPRRERCSARSANPGGDWDSSVTEPRLLLMEVCGWC